jgi:hypothetical protein
MLDEHWGLNVDLKYVHMKPKIDLVAGGADVSGRAKINPWIAGGVRHLQVLICVKTASRALCCSPNSSLRLLIQVEEQQAAAGKPDAACAKCQPEPLEIDGAQI